MVQKSALLDQVTVGFLPDMLVFSEDGNLVFVANEGGSAGDVDQIHIHGGRSFTILDADGNQVYALAT